MTLPSTKAAILYAPTDIRVEDRAIWAPAPSHVQIAIQATGLCGSDLHYFSAGRNGDFAVRAPLVLGHEASGVVTAVGAGVSHLQVGMRVAVEAGVYCRDEMGDCEYCRSGRYNLCKRMRFASSASRFPHLDGTLTGKMNHPAFVVHPIPDNCSFEQAALAEPLSVLIHASRRCGLSFTSPNTFSPAYPSSSSTPLPPSGPSVLVYGVGAIGLLACALARHQGASKICAVDINQQRLDWAKREGFADQVFCIPSQGGSTGGDGCCSPPQQQQQPPSKPSPTLASTLLSTFSQPLGFTHTFECTGVESSISTSILTASPGGKVCLIGMGARTVHLPISAAATREVDLVGVFRYANTYPEALAVLSDTTSPMGEMVAKLVTHRFKLEDTKKAFEMLRRGVDDEGGLVLKVMVGSSSSH